MLAHIAQTVGPRILIYLGMVSLLGATAGCNTVSVDVTAYRAAAADFPAPGTGARIAVLVASDEQSDLPAAELAHKAAALLAQAGYTTAAPQAADYVLTCDFGMDGGQTRTRYTARTEPPRVYRSYYYGQRRSVAIRSTVAPGYTVYTPEQYTVFRRWLRLHLHPAPASAAAARDADEAPPLLETAPLWQVEAVSVAPEQDLRWALNHLLLAAFDYWGKNTPRTVTVTRADEAEEVQALATAEAPPAKQE